MVRLTIQPSAVQGLGVFAGENLEKNQIVEVCVVLPLRGVPDNTGLWNHQLAWTEECDAIASGNALFYNHSDNANVRMIRDIPGSSIVVVATRGILYGEELFVKYACKPWW
jgi:hypothetical protein